MTCSSVCLFHDRRYSSNIQRILNLLRINIIKIKCDLNMIGKKSLCTCNLADDQLTITDEELFNKQNEFEKLKSNPLIQCQWPEEIDQLLQFKIMTTCDSKIAMYKLLKLICDISTKPNFPEMIRSIQKDGNVHSLKRLKSTSHRRNSNLIHRRIELFLPSNQIGHLIGRNGHLHKSIMSETETRIHFDNVPYLLSTSKQCTDFNLDLFQSSSTITATITGETVEAVEKAIKALEELDRTTQNNILVS